MPQILNSLERFFILRLNKGPAPLLDLSAAVSFYALNSALELNIFQVLQNAPYTAPELAKEIKCSEEGTALLIDVLVSLGYVKKKKKRYRNSAMTEKWILAKSPSGLKEGLQLYGKIMKDLMPLLPETVKCGKPPLNFYDWLSRNPDFFSLYQAFMMSLARQTIPELQKKVRLAGGKLKLLDIGGGHGLYSIAMCQKYPELSAAVFDSPYSRPAAESSIKDAGMSDRIQFLAGDYYTDDIGDNYDVVLLFNIIHEHPAAYNARLIEKAAGALAPRGCLLVLDELREKKLINIQNHIMNIYSLIFFQFGGGRFYSSTEIRAWLEAGDLKRIKRVNFYKTGLSLISGTLD